MNSDFCSELLENILDGVYYVDTERKITFWNRGAERITGYSKEEVMGHRCMDNILMHVDHRGNNLCVNGCPLADSLLDGKVREEELFLHHKNGERIPISVKIAPIYREGRIEGAVELFSDNSAKVAALQRIEKLMEENLTDPLTRVGNRRYAEITLHSRFDEMERYEWRFGLLFVDLDNFKHVNDTYGHSAGDEILTSVSGTLSHNIRSFDFVARWGGEEFIVLLVNIQKEDVLLEIAERFRFLIENSWIHHEEHTISVTASIGATISRSHDTIDSIINRADDLMYRSKKRGRNCVTMG